MHIRHCTAAVNVSAGDGTTGTMVVDLHGIGQGGRVTGAATQSGAIVALHASPAIVLASGGSSWLDIDLFPGKLSDIRDVHISGITIKTEAPRIP